MHTSLHAFYVFQVTYDAKKQRAAAARQWIEKAQLHVFLKPQLQHPRVVARGVEVVQQHPNAYTARGRFAQSVKHAQRGVVGKDRVILDVERFLRSFNQRHATGESQLGIADDGKARVIAGSGAGRAGSNRAAQHGARIVGQRCRYRSVNVAGQGCAASERQARSECHTGQQRHESRYALDRNARGCVGC